MIKPLRPLLTVLVLALAPAAAAHAAVLATPAKASSPVLWQGGAAWTDLTGVQAAAPGVRAHDVVSFKPDEGLDYAVTLDAGAGASVGPPSGALAYGFEEINSQFPPMGEGEDEVPDPSIPYGSAVTRRGLIGADGTRSAITDCGAAYLGYAAATVSLAGTRLAYACANVLSGTTLPASALTGTVGIGDTGAPTVASQTLPGGTPFLAQTSGDYLARSVGGDTPGTASIVVRDVVTGTDAYQLPIAPVRIALGADGTLVALVGDPACTTQGTYLGEWFAVANPVAHPFGCFYTGALRPVDGRWVGLAQGLGRHAVLTTVDLTTGASHPLADLARDFMFHGADFDGRQAAWIANTCDGLTVQLTPDVDAAGAPLALPGTCPMAFSGSSRLKANKLGSLRVAVLCRLGCPTIVLHTTLPAALDGVASSRLTLHASAKAQFVSLPLTRRQRTYLRRRGRVHITVVASVDGPGGVPFAARRRMYADLTHPRG